MTGFRTHIEWRWDDAQGGAGYRVIDGTATVALITPNLPGECWEAAPITPHGHDGADLIPARGFRDLEGAHAYCEAHAWEMCGEVFPDSRS